MLKIDNCLFGYEDGHRLLASSLKLDGESASQLTLLSDLAPGARFGSSSGYWTGFPFPKLDRYALMRTWPAPEMPRPGCVWTHALLIETSLFEDLADLSLLRELARRPQRLDGLAFYEQSIYLPADTLAERRDYLSVPAGRAVLAIFNNLYGSDEGAIPIERPGDLEDEVFAIWSQQWPRLRRNFRFQTAAADEVGAARSPFDLRLQWPPSVSAAPPSLYQEEVPPWLSVAVSDLSSPPHELRRFLWQFGKDVKKQRGSFRPLCEIFAASLKLSGYQSGPDLVRSISSWFAAKDDAPTLKQSLVDGEVLPRCQLDVLTFLLTQDHGRAFPLPSTGGISRLANFWPEEADKMLDLAEYAISEDSDLALSITGIVLGLIPASNFWAVTKNFPKVQQRMIQGRPDLLDSDEILDLDFVSLTNFIEISPVDHPVGAGLVKRLLHRANAEVAEKVLQHFPTFAVNELISEANQSDSRALRRWFEVLTRRPSLVLSAQVMEGIERTSTLYLLGDDLGWLSPAVVQAGTEPWVAALTNAKNDLSRDDGDILGSFLISLAIQPGGRGVQQIFEKYFDRIHDRILQSYLPWKANDLLLPRLPNVGWRRNWDTGFRLRLATAYAYIQNQLDPLSFASLTSDGKTRHLLAEAARELDGGWRYANSIELL
ncbi:hypothetical protein FBZ96_11083 [Bradyrhizobium stylosanthis]|uniref:Uncharacterized protein n=2 Tax=Bradyrhizobium stylosanthis TaxID=1803665 RepID=A0A560D6A4_9BRAD|nr:hypothetical protein FBZ96_11083 [Bradyrhizobium stylosanthis]